MPCVLMAPRSNEANTARGINNACAGCDNSITSAIIGYNLARILHVHKPSRHAYRARRTRRNTRAGRTDRRKDIRTQTYIHKHTQTESSANSCLFFSVWLLRCFCSVPSGNFQYHRKSAQSQMQTKNKIRTKKQHCILSFLS